MMHMTTPHIRALALTALLVLLATPLLAQRRQYLLELGAAGAVTSFASVTDLDPGFGGALRVGFWLPMNLGIELEGLASNPKAANGSSTNVLSGTASLLYNMRAGESSSLFLKAGLGTTKYGDSCPVVSVPGSGPCGSASEFVLGGGFRAALSPTIMIRGEVDYQRNSDLTSFDNFVGSLGLAFMVGSRPLIDSDRDGVFDRKDKCADTPIGAIVNKQGCPSDTDGDGVPDGLDRCPNTPAGATVDAAGCPSDSDKDGVVDGVDQCPETPAGSQVDATGCPTDADGDGVSDGLDRCPATPAGATVDALGCPGDSDNDKVPDGIDQCPNTPVGETVNSFGCPPSATPLPGAAGAAAGAAAATSGPTPGPWTVPGTAFAPQSSTIGGAALPVLDSVIGVLRADQRLEVEIVGHADDASSEPANIQLSAARADAVRNFLLSKGISPRQLQARGAGSSGADPDAAPGQNRRTDIRIIGS